MKSWEVKAWIKMLCLYGFGTLAAFVLFLMGDDDELC